MSGLGKVLQGVVGLVAQKKYHLLTREMIQNARADLNNLMKGVVGAQADNVESLRTALKAAEEKDWDKLEMVLVDAQIDYTTLMKALKKGYRPVPRTVESKKFTGIHDLMDVPTELDSLTRASKTFVIEKQEETDEVNTERYVSEDEKPAETARHENQPSLIESQQKEIEELKIRLSKLEEEKHRDKDQDSTVSNLGDTNRPTNLAERFSELYDNEWTMVLEELRMTKENHEDGNIKLLADILEAAFQYCKTLASDQFQEMWEKILFPMRNVPEWLNVSKKLQKEASRCLKEFRKDHGVLSIHSIQMLFTRKQLSKMIDPDLHTDNLMKYSNLCIQLSWLFNIQDPPMCLLWAHEGQRVSEHLRLYSGKGKTVSFNVWPSLLLHEGGPLLKKGVVQPHSN
ncbi:uncharacterized protein LOC134274859 [Saccostrea cucullata]|uniref:uncharacterized protein LOC134274859 n=1 Tax=Saccostrea cuccullata TaxID=36930 RepID=UPI002ED39987